MAGLQAFLAFFLSFVIVALATPLTLRIARRWKIGDKPNGRKKRAATIPHVGGIGMVTGTLVGLAVLSWVFDPVSNGLVSFIGRIIVPVGLIVVLGVTDDMRSLKARQKLTIQIVSAIILVVSGAQLLVGLPALDGNLLFVLLLTAFYLVGMSSSVNLIDGHDGLAGGVSLISAASFAALSVMVGAPELLFASLAIMGACLGFLLFNFPPGKVFMGDTGSMFLGLMLGIIACGITAAQPGMNTFVAVCLVLAVPVLDAWLAIARRLVLRRPVFQADHQHIHHIITSFGFTARQTLVVLYSIQAIMGCLGIMTMNGFTFPIIVGAGLFLALFLTFFRLMVASKEQPQNVPTKFAHTSIASLEK